MENIKLSVGQIEGETSLSRLIYESKGVASESKKRRIHGKPALKDMVGWLKSKKFGEVMEKELLKILYTYPQGSLGRFPLTLNNHVRAIQEKMRRGEKVVKKEMDLSDINHLKREEAIKQQQVITVISEQEKLRHEESKSMSEQLKLDRIEALKVSREKKMHAPALPEPEPEVAVSPKTPTHPEPTPEENAAALERRRMFAERLQQMTDGSAEEWMKG